MSQRKVMYQQQKSYNTAIDTFSDWCFSFSFMFVLCLYNFNFSISVFNCCLSIFKNEYYYYYYYSNLAGRRN